MVKAAPLQFYSRLQVILKKVSRVFGNSDVLSSMCTTNDGIKFPRKHTNGFTDNVAHQVYVSGILLPNPSLNRFCTLIRFKSSGVYKVSQSIAE